MTKQHGAHEPSFGPGPRSTHDDLIYSERHRKGWKSKGRRYPYKNASTGCDESLSIPQIAARASMRDEKARKHLNDWDWSVEKLFNKFGDIGATGAHGMKYIKRFIERQMIAGLSKDGLLDDQPDWVWSAVFELFTHA